MKIWTKNQRLQDSTNIAQDRRDSLTENTTLQSSLASKGSSTKCAHPASNAIAAHKEGGPKTKKRKPEKKNQQSGVKNNQAASTAP